MIKEKKIALLSSLALLGVFLLTATFVGHNAFRSLPVEGAGFVLGDNGTDVEKEATVNDKDVTVKTTFYDSTLDETGVLVKANRYVVWSNDADSPIRGISSLVLTTDAGSYSIYNDNVEVVCYSSYHHLDFMDIQFGGYDDLLTQGMFSFYPVSLGGDSVRYDIGNDNARYFLMVILTKMDIHITDVKVYAPCGWPSGSEAEGEYDSYTSTEQENLPSGFPFVGNGSYETTISPDSEVNFYVSGLKGNIASFRYRLVQFGYVLVDVTDATYTYQKLNPAATCDDERYFTLRRTEGETYDDFVFNERVTYYATPTYWVGPSPTNWPAASIASTIAEPSYEFVASDPFIGLSGVSYLNNPTYFAHAGWDKLDEGSVSIVLEAVRNYRERLIELGFILINDTFSPKSPGEPYGLANITLYSPDLQFEAGMIYQCDGPDKKCSATFEFHRNTTMDLSTFNAGLTENLIPEIGQGEMLFLDAGDFYYAAPIKFSDLAAYHEVLRTAEVDVGRFDKNELISNVITFSRLDDSLIYRVAYVTN